MIVLNRMNMIHYDFFLMPEPAFFFHCNDVDRTWQRANAVSKRNVNTISKGCCLHDISLHNISHVYVKDRQQVMGR